jgi:hypothetical protein
MSLRRNSSYGDLTHVAADPDESWLKMPEWESDDENADTKTYAWAAFTDAILKSIMTNNTGGSKVRTSITAVADMMESRLWLMDDDDHGGFSRHSCLCVLNIGDVVFKQLLRHLWPQWDKRIGSTLWEHLKTARACLKREKQYNANLPVDTKSVRGLKRWKAARNHSMLMRAADVRKKSIKWLEE